MHLLKGFCSLMLRIKQRGRVVQARSIQSATPHRSGRRARKAWDRGQTGLAAAAGGNASAARRYAKCVMGLGAEKRRRARDSSISVLESGLCNLTTRRSQKAPVVLRRKTLECRKGAHPRNGREEKMQCDAFKRSTQVFMKKKGKFWG